MVACNQFQRRNALSLGNLVAKKEAQDMTVGELMKLVAKGDMTIMEKLRYYAKNNPGRPSYFHSKKMEIMAYQDHIRIRSRNKETFQIFLTLSYADLHWPQLHRQFPGSSEYLNKQVTFNTPIVACTMNFKHIF